MKRRDLLKHLAAHGCVFRREGKEHSIYENSEGRGFAVPRHRDIGEILVKEICKDAGIPKP